MTTPTNASAGQMSMRRVPLRRAATEKLDGDGGAEWDPVDRGEKRDHHEARRDPEPEEREYIASPNLADRRAGDEQEDDGAEAEAQPRGAGRPEFADQSDGECAAELDQQHRGDGE